MRHAKPLPIVDKLVNEEKAPLADAVVVAPPVGIVELEIKGSVEKVEDVGKEIIGPPG